jgi:hypothetical protein
MFRDRKKLNQIVYIVAIIMIVAMIILTLAPAIAQ